MRPSSSTVTCGVTRAWVDDHVEHPHRPLGHGRDHRGVAGEGERPLRLDHVRLAVDLEAQHRALDHGEQPAAAGEGRERAVGVDLGQADPPRPVVGARQLTCRATAVGPRLRGDVVDAHDGDHGYFLPDFSVGCVVESAATKASGGTSTEPMFFIRFLPAFCFSSSLRLRLMSPP